MDSQDKRMCAMGDYDHELYDEDYLGNLNMWDFPGDCLEGDVGLPEDFASKLGPIPLPSEMLPPVVCGGPTDLLRFSTNIETFEPKYNPIRNKEPFKSHLKPQPPPTFPQQKNIYRIPKSFEAPSPDSVLERRSSTSSRRTISFGTEISIPVRSRTKRPRPSSTANIWSKITLQKKTKKRRKTPSPQQQQPNNENKKCSHCEITQTPQWREGPMGPKTLCNACGVRYRSGRLFPEYRPAASPTFIPTLHSNSHRKVIEMRQKGAGMDDDKFVVKKDFNSISTNVRLCS